MGLARTVLFVVAGMKVSLGRTMRGSGMIFAPSSLSSATLSAMTGSYRKLLCLTTLTLGVAICSCRGIGDALRMYGYSEIRPPSKLFEPGSLVWVESTHPFKAGIICPARKTLGRNFQATTSRTMDSQLAKATKRGVTLKADLQAIASAHIDVSAIKDLTMTLKNARIVEVDDYSIVTRRMVGDSLCAEMAARRRKEGYAVTMISSALQADVTYSVKWNEVAAADANLRIAALQGLAVGLGLEGSDIGDKTLSATGIYWGIRESEYLANSLSPENMRQVSRESRLLSIGAVPTVMPTIDAAQPLAPIPEAEEPAPEGHTDEEWQVLTGDGPHGPPPGHGRAASWHKDVAEALKRASVAPADSDSDSTETLDTTDEDQDPYDTQGEGPTKRQSAKPGALPLERSGSYLGNSRSNPRQQR